MRGQWSNDQGKQQISTPPAPPISVCRAPVNGEAVYSPPPAPAREVLPFWPSGLCVIGGEGSAEMRLLVYSCIAIEDKAKFEVSGGS